MMAKIDGKFVWISDPSYGISCLGKVNEVYENDKDLMIQFYRFAAKYAVPPLFSVSP